MFERTIDPKLIILLIIINRNKSVLLKMRSKKKTIKKTVIERKG